MEGERGKEKKLVITVTIFRSLGSKNANCRNYINKEGSEYPDHLFEQKQAVTISSWYSLHTSVPGH